jgi:hypothetical protein
VIFEDAEDFERSIGSSIDTMTLLLGGATLIAVIVSALGIQSAMMVNVTETNPRDRPEARPRGIPQVCGGPVCC